MGESKWKKLLGATGNFPRGKLNADDEGGLTMGLSVKDKTVILSFGKPVAWLGLDKQTALMLGASLISKAQEIT